MPSLGEKLIVAFTSRRELLAQLGVMGLRVVGPAHCRATNTVREFLYKNFVPFTWVDPESEQGRMVLAALGSVRNMPVIECSDGRLLVEPTLQALASEAGIWQHCPSQEIDFAIVGAGPAGIAAAVYAASEGLSTLMLDRLGPGGQVGGSSRIENFIGFPAGLSGAELATRGVLQMLKFGARIVAPVEVQKLIPASSANELHALVLNCGAEIRCRVILLALGVHWRRLEAKGTDRFTGQGVYYACTTVEADIYDRADVAVIGAGNSAGQAVMFLAECCRTRTVHLLIRRTLGPGMSEYLANRVRAAANVVIHEQTEVERSAEIIASRRLCCETTSRPWKADCPARRCSSLSAPSRRRIGCRRASRATPTVISSPVPTSFVQGFGPKRTATRVPWRQPCPAYWRPATSAPDPRSVWASPWATVR